MCVSRYFAKGNLVFIPPIDLSSRDCSREGKDLTAHSPRGLVACLRSSEPRQRNDAICAGSDCVTNLKF